MAVNPARAAWIAGAVLLAAAWAAVLGGGGSMVEAMASGGWGRVLAVPELLSGTDPARLLGMLRLFLLEVTALFAGAWVVSARPAAPGRLAARVLRVKEPSGLARRTFEICVFLGSTYVAFHALYVGGFEGPWYPLAGIMRFEGDPPFQHRLLFVWAANAVHAVFPGWAATRCFFLSQFPVYVLAFYAIRKWAELFVPPERAVWSQPLLALMLIPTLGYFNFYDAGVILTYTAGLYFLFTERPVPFLAVLVLGTLNHEVSLLLVPVFAAYHFDRMPRGRLLSWLAVQVVAYAAVRLALFHVLPAPEAYSEGKLWMNIHFLTERPGPTLRALAAVVFWYGAALPGLSGAPLLLRRCLVLLPLLAVLVLLVGQVNESRLWHPLLPVALALILIGVFGREPTGDRTAG